MALQTQQAPPVAALAPFTIVVPGHQTWRLLSVIATFNRDTAATPTRAFTLTITDGITNLLSVGATDPLAVAGTETVSWCNCAGSSVVFGTVAVVSATVPNVQLLPGYQLVGTIQNATATDQWTRALAWFDYTATD